MTKDSRSALLLAGLSSALLCDIHDRPKGKAGGLRALRVSESEGGQDSLGSFLEKATEQSSTGRHRNTSNRTAMALLLLPGRHGSFPTVTWALHPAYTAPLLSGSFEGNFDVLVRPHHCGSAGLGLARLQIIERMLTPQKRGRLRHPHPTHGLRRPLQLRRQQ